MLTTSTLGAIEAEGDESEIQEGRSAALTTRHVVLALSVPATRNALAAYHQPYDSRVSYERDCGWTFVSYHHEQAARARSQFW